MTSQKIPVLIAGGGPVGLALAIELGMAGIACTLVEQRDGTIGVPKMSGLSIRSMEFNRRWGIAEKVKRAGWPQTHPNDFVYCTSMARLRAGAPPQSRPMPRRSCPTRPSPAAAARRFSTIPSCWGVRGSCRR